MNSAILLTKKGEIAVQFGLGLKEKDPNIIHVYRILSHLENDPAEPVKLLMVNLKTSPVGIIPIEVMLEPINGETYRITIVEITPEEWGKIQTQEIQLYPDWKVDCEIGA
jgi:hypothetical protein